jgi:hypothetical protein
MAELSCQQCHDQAAELALGVLCGRQRAGVLAHLHRCASCEDLVGELTVTADRLIELLPGVEPPAGFDQRVITAVVAPAPRARRRWMIAAAVVVSVALPAGGWMVARAAFDVPPPATDAQVSVRMVMFTPFTAEGRQVGQAYVYPGRPSWMYLLVDTDNAATSGAVDCELIHRDGSTMRLGTFLLTQGYSGWGTPAPIDPTTLAAIRLVSSDGRTLATAHFTSPASAPAGHPLHAPTAPTPQPRHGGQPVRSSSPGAHPAAHRDGQFQDHQPHGDHQRGQGGHQRQDHQHRPGHNS